MRDRKDFRVYQEIGYNHIIKNEACGLFKDMGLGKTVTTLTAINDLLNWVEVSKVLVISTKQVANNVWSNEVLEWNHLRHLKVMPVNGTADERTKKLKVKADIYTISIDGAIWLLGKQGGTFGKFDMVVLDESSLVKNGDTKRFKVLRKAFKLVKRKVLLTGTPTPNGLIDLWTQMFLLDSGERLFPTVTKFRQVFAMPNPNGFGYTVKPEMTNVILKRISDICLSIRAKDYGVEIPTIEITRYVDLNQSEHSDYKKFEADAIHTFMYGLDEHEITAINSAVLTGKLLQFANGGMYDSEKVFHKIHDAKLEALSEVLDEINSPIIVACHYKSDRDRIIDLCTKKKLKTVAFSSQNVEQSARTIKEWNERKIDVLIMHPKSGGHGLNLQKGGHHVIWFGVSLSTESEQQLNARLARTGQNETVRIIKLITKGTLEEKFVKRTNAKKSLQNFVLDYLRDYGID